MDTGDRQAGIPISGGVFEQLRADPASANLVAYSGVELVRAIRRYRAGQDVPWITNTFFGADTATIDAELVYGSDDWRYRVSGNFRLAGELEYSRSAGTATLKKSPTTTQAARRIEADRRGST